MLLAGAGGGAAARVARAGVTFLSCTGLSSCSVCGSGAVREADDGDGARRGPGAAAGGGAARVAAREDILLTRAEGATPNAGGGARFSLDDTVAFAGGGARFSTDDTVAFAGEAARADDDDPEGTLLATLACCCQLRPQSARQVSVSIVRPRHATPERPYRAVVDHVVWIVRAIAKHGARSAAPWERSGVISMITSSHDANMHPPRADAAHPLDPCEASQSSSRTDRGLAPGRPHF